MKAATPVNACIYCGESDVAKLSDEHVIPYAFQSDLKLRRASCHDCAKITHSFEGHVAGGMYGDFRLSLGGRSRNKKRKPKSLPLWVEFADQCDFVDVPIEYYPSSFPIVRFNGWPRLMESNEDVPATATISVVGSGERLRRLYPDMKNFRVPGTVHLSAFVRMIAKIAHCLTVHQLGIDGFEPLLLDLILRAEGDPADFVGCAPSTPEATRSLTHDLEVLLVHSPPEIDPPIDFVVCRVRLFSNLGTPPYLVVVGRPNDLTVARLEADSMHS